jgi:hypothetical protein
MDERQFCPADAASRHTLSARREALAPETFSSRGQQASTAMSDPYRERPEELARFYARRMAEGFGPNLDRRLTWAIRDAGAALDRRRVRFWESVRALADGEYARRR